MFKKLFFLLVLILVTNNSFCKKPVFAQNGYYDQLIEFKSAIKNNNVHEAKISIKQLTESLSEDIEFLTVQAIFYAFDLLPKNKLTFVANEAIQNLKIINDNFLNKLNSIKKQTEHPKPELIWSAIGSHKYDKHKLKDIFIEQIKLFPNDVNKYIPVHSPNNLRIATYNVHMFKDPKGRPNFNNILNVIRSLNADIVILQEFIFDKPPHAKDMNKIFGELGYKNISFAGGAHKDSGFGNIILSKYPFASQPEKKNFGPKGKKHKRSYVKVEIDLSKFGKKNLVIYGTHLEVESEQLRIDEVNELVAKADKYNTKNIIIVADFNETRFGQALKNLEKAGFTDCFTLSQTMAHFTHWTGKILDLIYLKPVDLNIPSAYIYYDWASDHMPVIADIPLK